VTEWIMLAAALLLVAACGVFVAAEFAFVTVSRAQVDRAAAEGLAGAAGVQTALRSLSTQLSGAQVGITLTNLAIGYLAEPSVAALLYEPLAFLGDASRGVSFAIALTVATILTMLFGELVPKNLAIADPMGVARAVQLPQRMFTAATRPLTVPLNGAANAIVRRLGIEPQEELASAHSPSELVSLLERSAEAGTIDRPTASLVQGSLRLDDKLARDVMTPRTTTVTVAADDPVSRVLEISREHGFSRFPVTGRDPDDIVGTIELRDVVAVPASERTTTPVRLAMRPALTVPDSLPLDDLLWQLRDRGSELAVVFDEYGGTAGLVTFEDIVEEIVGEVSDEHDPPEPPIAEVAPRVLRISGLVRPDELRVQYGIRLPEGGSRYDTIGGLVLDRLGRMPEVGDRVVVGGIELEVVALDGHRIDWLHLTRKSDDADE
jgi:CBS domain containing-hemolysin-like protein